VPSRSRTTPGVGSPATPFLLVNAKPSIMGTGLFASPELIDLILLFAVVEAAVLTLWHRRTGRGLSVIAVGLMLLPGICLLLALRAALTGRAWPWVPGALAAALIAHLADLRSRWRR
jgi:hypothetical protein